MPQETFVWSPTPTLLETTAITAFLRRHGLSDYNALLARAAAEPGWFWDALLQFFDVRFDQPYTQVLDDSAGMAWAKWCVGGTTNLVLNALDRHRGTATWQQPAIAWEGEDGSERRLSYAQLNGEVCRLAGALRDLGIEQGDVVALYMPMVPEVSVAFLAVAKIGAIAMPLFSGFGPQPIGERLADSGAKAVITVDSTLRRGKRVPMKEVLDGAVAGLPNLRHVIVHRQYDAATPMQRGRDVWWADIVSGQAIESPTAIVPAEAPVMLLYTSGTTGRAKGTVHTHCGVIAKNLLDVGLCLDLHAGERLMWMSDMGWAAGPKIVMAAPLLGATLVLAEGAPDYPDAARQWRLIEKHRVTLFGTVPTAVRQMMRHPVALIKRHNLTSLRAVVTAGEPWNGDAWSWFFEHVCERRVPILNYGGGTECGGAILIGTLHQPLKPCAFGGPVPGTGADIVDTHGHPCTDGQMGELVLRSPSIGLTRGLWHDPGRYLESYWQQIPGVWVQGDLARRDADGLWYLLGRSDDTIKIAGKRTGPAEIESVLVGSGLVAECAVIGLPDALTGSSLACVCVPLTHATKTPHLQQAISTCVAARFGAPYRPKLVLLTSSLPKTRNEKIMRRVIRAVLSGAQAGDLSALVNPEAVAELQALTVSHEH
jgi:acetyl-CoA synthetase